MFYKEVCSTWCILSPFDLSDSSSKRTAGSGSSLRELLVVNCDLEPESVDSELRVALQWIAASELGLPVLYFRKSKEKRSAKVGNAVNKSEITCNKFIAFNERLDLKLCTKVAKSMPHLFP